MIYYENGRMAGNQFEYLLSAPTSGFVYRNCTVYGWSEMYPPYQEACAFSDDNESESEVHTLCCCNHANQLRIFILFLLPLHSSSLAASFSVQTYLHVSCHGLFVLWEPLWQDKVNRRAVKHQRSHSFRLLCLKLEWNFTSPSCMARLFLLWPPAVCPLWSVHLVCDFAWLEIDQFLLFVHYMVASMRPYPICYTSERCCQIGFHPSM